MRLSFFGSSLVSSYWNGAATYYRGLLGALAKRGHEITFFEPDAFGRQQNRDMDDPDWARVVVWEPTAEGMARALDEARDCDVLVKASGVGLFDAELEEAVLAPPRGDRIVAFWDVDAPATLERIALDPGDHLRRLCPSYDVVFTYGGGEPVIDAYHRLGAVLCVPVYNGLDPETHHPVPREERYAGKLGFLGNRLPDRESRVEEFFLKPAAMLPEASFLLGGAGWEDKGMSRNVHYLGHVGTRQHNAFNASLEAVLNINRASMARFGFSPPTRIFEAAGAGACLITDAWMGIEEFLKPGLEVLVARSGEEVVEHLQALTPERAKAIGEAARQRMLAEHTYDRRALLVERVFERRCGVREAAA